MYAVIAPGFSCIYSNWKDVERVKSLYPYPKFHKFQTEQEASEWLQRNQYARQLDKIYNYGNTFSDFYVDVKYKIAEDCVYYVLDVSRLGRLRLFSEDALVEYKGWKIYVKFPNIKVSNESISGHMSALFNLYNMIGPYVDVNLELEYYALYYALTIYNRSDNRSVAAMRSLLNERMGATAISLKFKED